MRFKKLIKKNSISYVLIFATIISFISSGIRIKYFDSLPVGTKSYLFLQNSNLTPQSLLFIGVFSSLGIALALPFFFHSFKINRELSLLFSLLFIASPLFINLILSPNITTLAFFIGIIAIASIRLHILVSLFLALVASYYDPWIGISLAIAYFILKRKISFSLVSIVSLVSFYYGNNKYVLNSFITDLGANYGFSAFSIILAFMGFYIIWKQKKKYWLHFLLGSLFFVFLKPFPNLIFSVNIIISILSGIAILFFINRKWVLSSMRYYGLLLIVCGILFSQVSFISSYTKEDPNGAMIESLNFIKESVKEGKIITHPDYFPYIKYFSGRDSFFNEDFFYNRSIFQVRKVADEEGIAYIWITKEMKDGLVWNKKDEGILFLFRNNKTFRNVYNQEGYEIWELLI